MSETKPTIIDPDLSRLLTKAVIHPLRAVDTDAREELSSSLQRITEARLITEIDLDENPDAYSELTEKGRRVVAAMLEAGRKALE